MNECNGRTQEVLVICVWSFSIDLSMCQYVCFVYYMLYLIIWAYVDGNAADLFDPNK